MLPTRYAAAFFLAVAVATTLLTFWSYRNTSAFVARSESTVATVTNSERDKGPRRYLRFEYEDAAGRIHQGHSGGRGPWYGWRAGDDVRVVYDPEPPEQARLDMLSELWTGPLVFGTVALGLYILGGAFACFGWMVPVPEPLPAPATSVRRRQAVRRSEPGPEVRRLLDEGHVLAAIRLYREETGLRLIEAKAIIDELRRRS